MAMKNRGFMYLVALGSLVLVVGLACGSSAAPTAAPAPTQEAQPTATESSGGDTTVTFADQNSYFTIDVPGGWKHTQDVDSDSSHWYWDVIKAPDGHAGVESVVYDDGTAWTGSQNGREALYLLHKFYSKTGQEGDIRVTSDSIQKDKSERLTWTSRGGNYSGVSFFEVRHKTAFLMFTTWWDNDYADKYKDLLDSVISSYR
jgi:hypothetical protein